MTYQENDRMKDTRESLKITAVRQSGIAYTTPSAISLPDEKYRGQEFTCCCSAELRFTKTVQVKVEVHAAVTFKFRERTCGVNSVQDR